MKLFCKTLVAVTLSGCLWSSSINALPYPRSQQCLAVVALLIGGLGAGATLLAWGINDDNEIKMFSGSCLLAVTVIGTLFIICVAPHNWYGTE